MKAKLVSGFIYEEKFNPNKYELKLKCPNCGSIDAYLLNVAKYLIRDDNENLVRLASYQCNKCYNFFKVGIEIYYES
ncbi:MAG: hypothetical protein PHF86_01530 [Candidatus Nanoarchaeia archaeon]|nr:hypothetical protein [Candidatus Nanoarchaeia archaeon]